MALCAPFIEPDARGEQTPMLEGEWTPTVQPLRTTSFEFC